MTTEYTLAILDANKISEFAASLMPCVVTSTRINDFPDFILRVRLISMQRPPWIALARPRKLSC